MNRIALLTLVLALLTAVIPAKADDEAQTELRLNPHIEESRTRTYRLISEGPYFAPGLPKKPHRLAADW